MIKLTYFKNLVEICFYCFQINHVYQFEFMSQHLVFANCIPLVLKFFNQNIMAYIASKNKYSIRVLSPIK